MDKLNILLVTGVVATEHDYRTTNDRLRVLLESTGRFNVRINEEFDGATAATLSKYDAILLNYDGKNTPTDPLYQRFGGTAEDAFFDFVASGKGVAIYHSSVWLSEEVPDRYKELWGLYYTTPGGGRRCPTGEFPVRVIGGDPISEGVPDFLCINDDLFGGYSLAPGARIKPLATVYDDLAYYDVAWFPPPHHPVIIPEGKKENMPRVNTDTPVCWTNTFGKGRVYATSVGHEVETQHSVPFDTLLIRGLEWAATGSVTMDPPSRTGAERQYKWPYYTNGTIVMK